MEKVGVFPRETDPPPTAKPLSTIECNVPDSSAVDKMRPNLLLHVSLVCEPVKLETEWRIKRQATFERNPPVNGRGDKFVWRERSPCLDVTEPFSDESR